MPDLRRLIDDLAAAGLWPALLHIALIVVATLVALRFARVLVSTALTRLFDREAAEGTAQDVSSVELQRRRQTLDGLAYRALRVVILVIAFLMVLGVLQLDIGPAIAGLGVVGLALSLGAQHLVRDYVAGAFVLIENQYSKGDTVTIAGVTGTVEDISLRRTTLRDIDGTVHYVPHGLIQTSSNHSRNWAAIGLNLPVPYGQDVSAVAAAVEAAGERLAADRSWRGAVFEKPRVAWVENLSEQGMVVHVSGSIAALHRQTAAGALRGLIVEEAERRGVVIGWRAVPADSPEPRSPGEQPRRAADATDEATAATSPPENQ